LALLVSTTIFAGIPEDKNSIETTDFGSPNSPVTQQSTKNRDYTEKPKTRITPNRHNI